eukprot:3628541-Pleurochrysis_carterae.AAC.4
MAVWYAPCAGRWEVAAATYCRYSTATRGHLALYTLRVRTKRGAPTASPKSGACMDYLEKPRPLECAEPAICDGGSIFGGGDPNSAQSRWISL